VSAQAPRARIADIRYARYEGPRRGRAASIWSLARFGALGALGARRGWKAKVVPGALIAVAFAPALVLLVLRAVIGAQLVARFPDLIPYRDYEREIGIVVLLFAGIVTPELVCPDRRDNVLSLYLSTAVSRVDYVAGRILGAVLPLLCVTGLPVLMLFAENVMFADHPVGYVEQEWGALPRIAAAAIVIALYYALLGLAISSLTSRRTFAVGGYVGLMVATTAVGGILAFGVQVGSYAQLVQLARLPIAASVDLFGQSEGRLPLSAGWWWLGSAVVAAASLAVLAWRYRAAATS
jgi:ABC-2 type transport system permease protein